MIQNFVDNLINGATKAHKAVEEGENNKLSILSKAELMQTDEDGETPLHYAATNGNLEICKILINKCPEILFIRDNDGGTAYDYAVKYSENRELINFLKR